MAVSQGYLTLPSIPSCCLCLSVSHLGRWWCSGPPWSFPQTAPRWPPCGFLWSPWVCQCRWRRFHSRQGWHWPVSDSWPIQENTESDNVTGLTIKRQKRLTLHHTFRRCKSSSCWKSGRIFFSFSDNPLTFVPHLPGGQFYAVKTSHSGWCT